MLAKSVCTFLLGFAAQLPGASLVAQQEGIHLPLQEIQVPSLGQEDPLEKDNGSPLQYSCRDNPMDREAWWVTVHGVAKELDRPEWLKNNKPSSSQCLRCVVV